MLSPEQSDIRKSLDSIQSMLSSSNAAAGRSPIQATSLSSRLMIQHHHASSMMEGARRSSQAEEESPASSSTGVRRPSAIRRSPSSAFSTVSNSMMAAAAGGGAENDNSPTRFTNNYMDRHNLGSIEVVEEHPIVEWEEEEFDYGPALSLPRQYLPDLDEKLHHSSYRPSRVIVRHP